MPAPQDGGTSAAKTALRDQLVTARNRRPLLERADVAAALVEHLLAAPEVRRAASIAAYVSVGAEPGTGPLLRALLARGTRVLLPCCCPTTTSTGRCTAATTTSPAPGAA